MVSFLLLPPLSLLSLPPLLTQLTQHGGAKIVSSSALSLVLWNKLSFHLFLSPRHPKIYGTHLPQPMLVLLVATFNNLKARFRAITKGPQSISEFTNAIKLVSDEIAFLGDPVNHEDLIERVLDGIGDPNYAGLIEVINACDYAISFAEFKEKLTMRELYFKSQPVLVSFLASAHTTTTHPNYSP